MGVDLYMLPLDCDMPELQFSHTVLNCQRRANLWEI